MSDHTKGPWSANVMANLQTKQQMIDYVTKCINDGGDKFFFVSSDDDKDICHTGNGPTSEKNALRISNCVNALEGVKDYWTFPIAEKMRELKSDVKQAASLALGYARQAHTGDLDSCKECISQDVYPWLKERAGELEGKEEVENE